jgi:hypothetical protein
MSIGAQQAFVDLFMPNTMLGLRTTSISLLAVAVTKAWVNSQSDVATGCDLTELVDHVW